MNCALNYTLTYEDIGHKYGHVAELAEKNPKTKVNGYRFDKCTLREPSSTIWRTT
jgi:hypothetical protein